MFLERDQWWDLACVLDLPGGTGVVYNPEERRRADEHPKGSLNNQNSGYNNSSGNSGRGGIYGGLANVGGRLLPFENPETTQQHIQDTADNKHITGILSVITTKMFHHSISEEEWVAQRFFEYTSLIIEGIKDLGPDTGSGRRNENDYHNEKHEKNNEKYSDKNEKNSERNEKNNEKHSDRPEKPERQDKLKKKDSEYATVRMAALRSSPEMLLIPTSPWTWVVPILSTVAPLITDAPSLAPSVASPVALPVISSITSSIIPVVLPVTASTAICSTIVSGVSDGVVVDGDVADGVPAFSSISHINLTAPQTVTESVLGSSSSLPLSIAAAAVTATGAGVMITTESRGVTGILSDESHPLNTPHPPNPPYPPIQRNLSRLDHHSVSGVTESTLRIHIRRLLHSTTAYHGNLSNLEVVLIFSDILRSLYSESSVQALLTLLPLSLGGIDPIGMGLLHPNPTVRLNSLGIIQKFLQYPSTIIAVQSMNDMLLVAYKRQLKLYESGELGRLIVMYEIRLKAEEKAVFSPLKHPTPYTHPTHPAHSGISGSSSRPIATLLSPNPQSNQSNHQSNLQSNQTGAYEMLSPSSPNDHNPLSPLSPVSPVSLAHSVSPLSPGGEHRTSTTPTTHTAHTAPTVPTAATSHIAPTVVLTAPTQSANNELDIIPTALLSFAAAASGFMTGMTGILTATVTDPTESYTDINNQRESDQGATFPPIELIPY